MFSLNSDDLHRIFEKLDRNGDGLVSLDELEWLLDGIGVHTTRDEVESLVGKTNLDIIDFLFFYENVIKQNTAAGVKDESSDDDELVNAFKVFDLNGDGFISSEELENVLTRLGLWDEQSGKDCKSMINVYDANLDGVLDFEEFKNMMLPTNS